MSHFSAFFLFRNCLDVAAGSHYAVTGPGLMHTNDCAAKVYFWVCRLSKSQRSPYQVKVLLQSDENSGFNGGLHTTRPYK